jgi:hypothetical protein
MTPDEERRIKEWLARCTDTARIKRELVRIARDYILKCERYDQKISKVRDERGWAALVTPAAQADSEQHARRVLRSSWEYVAEAGYDKAFFDQALRGEANLVETMTWDAYRTMARPDFDGLGKNA